MKIFKLLLISILAINLSSFSPKKEHPNICEVLNIIANDKELFNSPVLSGTYREDTIGRVTQYLTSMENNSVSKITIFDTLNFFSCQLGLDLKPSVAIVNSIPDNILLNRKNKEKGLYFLSAIGQDGEKFGVALKDLSNLTYIIYTFKIENSKLRFIEKRSAIF